MIDFHFNNIILLNYAVLSRHLQPHLEDPGTRNFIALLSCSLQVGVVQYGERVAHEFSLDDFQTVDEVVSAAQNIIQRGGEETRTALGISVARYTKKQTSFFIFYVLLLNKNISLALSYSVYYYITIIIISLYRVYTGYWTNMDLLRNYRNFAQTMK